MYTQTTSSFVLAFLGVGTFLGVVLAVQDKSAEPGFASFVGVFNALTLVGTIGFTVAVNRRRYVAIERDPVEKFKEGLIAHLQSSRVATDVVQKVADYWVIAPSPMTTASI